ncbi:MAG: helix-turn-helix domain-containing protein [Jatrophihabitans sp.]
MLTHSYAATVVAFSAPEVNHWYPVEDGGTVTIQRTAVTLPDHDLIQAIANELDARKQQFVDQLVSVTRVEIGDLKHDDELAFWLVASIAENTVALIEMLRDDVDPRRVTTPPGAIEYAVRLARANVSLPPLLRAYRFGQMMFTQMCLDVAGEMDVANLDTVRDLVARVAESIDQLCEIVQTAYSAELVRISDTPGGLRQQWIARLMTDGHIDVERAEAALGYPLRGPHFAVEMWCIDAPGGSVDSVVDECVRIVATAVGNPPRLCVLTGGNTAQAWFATDREPDPDAVRRALRRTRVQIRLSIGVPSRGLSGFRQSSVVAARTKRVARGHEEQSPTVTNYREVEAVALLREDPPAVREFVERALGPLAADDERTRGLRETLLVFLECNRTPGPAAERLMVHRNTVRYRVDQAIAIRGRPIDTDPLELMLALAAAKWFGAAVLSTA